jgi:hypothetical protein
MNDSGLRRLSVSRYAQHVPAGIGYLPDKVISSNLVKYAKTSGSPEAPK